MFWHGGLGPSTGKSPNTAFVWLRASVAFPVSMSLGYLERNRKYGSYQAYYKHISQKTNQQAQAEHKDFLAGVKNWLKQHQEDPEKFKLKSKEDLLKTQKQLIISKKQGGKTDSAKETICFELPLESRETWRVGSSQRGGPFCGWCAQKRCVAPSWRRGSV